MRRLQFLIPGIEGRSQRVPQSIIGLLTIIQSNFRLLWGLSATGSVSGIGWWHLGWRDVGLSTSDISHIAWWHLGSWLVASWLLVGGISAIGWWHLGSWHRFRLSLASPEVRFPSGQAYK
jgi:hypothetical protein